MQQQYPGGTPKVTHPPPWVAGPLRDSLRHLRDAFHLGRGLAGDVIERSPLPPPVSGLARGVLTELDRVAARVGTLAEEAVRDLLGDDGAEVAEADRRFAQGFARAFALALERMGCGAAPLDAEEVARIHARLPGGDQGAARRAALLLEGLVTEAAGPAEASGDARIAAFAALLWLLSDRARDPAALLACADLAFAVGPEIQAASGDPEALARLFAEFRDHV